MLKYLVRRILHFPLTLFGSITFTFILVRFLPGEPFRLGEKTPRAYIDEQNHLHGLDLTLPLQYWNFLTRVIRLDFGNSFFQPKQTVISLIWQHFTVSIVLVLIAFAIMLLVGLSLGLFTASKQGSWLDYILNNTAIFVSSVPSFVYAAFALASGKWLAVAFVLWEAPIGGWGNMEKGVPPTLLQVLVPALVLSIHPTVTIMRMTYTEVVDVKAQDYVRTAYSKGLGRGKVLLRHIIRNSFIPVASTAGNLFSNLLIGTMVVEYVFRVPGLGGYFINSILNLDYPIIVGGVCFYTLVIASVNLLVDLLYPAVDPRITYTKSQK